MTEPANLPALPQRRQATDHPQPDPRSYSTDQLCALLLEDFTHQSPSQSAAVRLLCDHRRLLERADVRSVAVTVLGWRPGQEIPPAPAWQIGAHWNDPARGYPPEFGKGRGIFARFDYREALAAGDDGRLELGATARIILGFALVLDGSEGAMRKLDAINREHVLRAWGRAGGMELAALVMIADPFPAQPKLQGDVLPV